MRLLKPKHNMKIIFTSLLSLAAGAAFAQTTINNGGFENWGNPSPGNANEPTGWYSNKSGSNLAQAGPQTCYEDNSVVHSGNASVRLESKTYLAITVVNGNVTTGVINAPSTNKSDGFIGTQNYSDTTDQRRMAFVGKPDSLVGWYQYTQGGATETGRVKAILHTGQYFDPETPTTYHIACASNKIASAEFTTPASNVGTWTRFSVPFVYLDTSITPEYIMINMTSSSDQTTTVSGSKMWIDDLEAIYNPPPSNGVAAITSDNNVKVFSSNKTLYVDFYNRNNGRSIISVFDLSGKCIGSYNITNSNLNTIDLSGLNSGLYLYKLNSDGYQKAGKFVVE
jgi:hypothetical protein